MILIDFRLKNQTGVAVRITEEMRDINIQHHRFSVEKTGLWIWKRRVGRMIIVVRDENRKKALELIKETEKNYRLGVRKLKTFYWVKVCLEDKEGGLNAVLWRLAKEEIDLRYSESIHTFPEGNPPERKKVVLLIFDCPRANYARAKTILGSCARVLDEPTFVHESFFDSEGSTTLQG